MRRGVLAFLAVLAIGLAGLLWNASEADRGLAHDLGVLPAGVVAELARGEEACQQPVGLPQPVEQVGVWLGPADLPRGPVRVSLRSMDALEDVVAATTVDRRPLPIGWVIGELDRTAPAEADVAVCVENLGGGTLEVLGDFDSASGLAPPRRFAGRVLSNPTRSTDDLVVEGEPRGFTDLAAIFPHPEPRSLLAEVPGAFRRAERFKPAGVGSWTWWVLLVGAAVGAPVALARALLVSERTDET